MASTQCFYLGITKSDIVVTVHTLGCALDELLDVEYEKTVKELKAEEFVSCCCQERHDEHIV